MSTASLKEMPLHTDMFLEHQYSTGWAKEKKKDKTDSIFKICSKSEVGGLPMLKYQFSSLNSNNLKVNSFI